MRRVYFIAPTLTQGMEDARARGWSQIAFHRFATETGNERYDIIVVDSLSHLNAASDKTLMVKAPSYDDGPPVDYQKAVWEKRVVEFDEFVASGRAEWFDL